MVIESLGDADMRPREIPETHCTILNGEAECKVAARIVEQDMAGVTEKLFLVLEDGNQ